MINKEENVFAQIICHLIQVYNVYNVYHQVIGIQIKEDVFNAQMNRFLIELKDTVHYAQKMLHYSKITNVSHVHKIHITIKQG